MSDKARRLPVFWWVVFGGVITLPATMTLLSIRSGEFGYALAFAAITAVYVAALVFFVWAQESSTPIPVRPRPALVFRLVKRDERAIYVRIMRRTLAVQMRDFNRQTAKALRELGKAFLPVIQRAVDALNAAFKTR